MTVRWIIWKNRFVDKIRGKHGVEPHEVEEALKSGACFRKAEKGRVPGEHLYVAYGRTAAGRYLTVLFLLKKPDRALPISARDMTTPEKRHYGKKATKR